MGLFSVNTKAANVGFGTLTTGAVVGTFAQLPNVVCDEVLLSITTATPLAIQVSNAAAPGAGLYLVVPPTQNPVPIKTGGNLNNLFVGPSTAVAAVVGYQWVQYKPVT